MQRILLSLAAFLLLPALPEAHGDDVPQAHDPRLEVVLFAREPNIVHPVSVDFDARGRLLVIESHTHFPPANYKGLKHDRIRILEDSNGDGRADRFATFFEGTTATMDIAAHPDGSVYLATRNEILRLRDTDGDGQADEKRRVVFLDTKGDYPHNGLSGLCFDSRGDLYFGMGENLGADYKLLGADGVTLSDQGEGGNVFWCTAEGKRLRRVATGFWNPFGVCRDVFGRLFAVDNDPDARPPCRLMHIVEGADFGYQFRYGRSGRHPFQAWDGQLPGTLPQVSGTGEAPCEVLSYESDGLPQEYLGSLLVASWADHRVERYALKEKGASLRGERLPFVQGGKDFRPVGLAVAPDGSLFVSDWVLKDYTLHGKGAVWQVRPKAKRTPERPADPRRALSSTHRPLRESAARRLAADAEGRRFLHERLSGENPDRTRATALTALIDAGDKSLRLGEIAQNDPLPAIQALAVRGLVERGETVTAFAARTRAPAMRSEAIRQVTDKNELLSLLTDPDPYLRHAAVQRLAHAPDLLKTLAAHSLTDPQQRIGILLAHRASGDPQAARRVADFLADRDDEVRFLAVKWIADRQLAEYRAALVQLLADRTLNLRLYAAGATALARLDGKDVSEAMMADSFVDRLADDRGATAARTLALQMVPSSHPRLTLDLLRDLLAKDSEEMRREAVRALAEHPHPRRIALLRTVAHNERLSPATRAFAVVGLADAALESTDDLMRLTQDASPAVREEALRALTGRTLASAQKQTLQGLPRTDPRCTDLVARLLGQSLAKGRPPASDLDAWQKRLEGPADAEAGRRVFAHPRLAACTRCHRAEGRGQDVGPDLSTIGHRESRPLLEALLQPSNQIAPQYQVWQIETKDGKSRLGMLHRTVLDESTYVDEKGGPFTLNTRDIVESRPVTRSLMPEGLVDLLTDQELRDLLAYLQARR